MNISEVTNYRAERLSYRIDPDRRKAAEPIVLCHMFAMCTNDAETFVSNPILGDVPSCNRCADKVNSLS